MAQEKATGFKAAVGRELEAMRSVRKMHEDTLALPGRLTKIVATAVTPVFYLPVRLVLSPDKIEAFTARAISGHKERTERRQRLQEWMDKFPG